MNNIAKLIKKLYGEVTPKGKELLDELLDEIMNELDEIKKGGEDEN